jgi:aldehyde dehydrogenase (NAD+)
MWRAFTIKVGKGIQASQEFGRIINRKNFERLKFLLDDAIEKGASIAYEGQLDKDENFISPYLVTNVCSDMEIMKEEIFGPLLPIVTYKNLEEVPALIKKLEKPLALYILSKSKKNTDFIIQNTSSGGTAVNELMVTSVKPEFTFWRV